jgi:hypothetical protein
MVQYQDKVESLLLLLLSLLLCGAGMDSIRATGISCSFDMAEFKKGSLGMQNL